MEEERIKEEGMGEGYRLEFKDINKTNRKNRTFI